MSNPSRLADFYKGLKAAGLDVYFPGQKKGECTSPYVVVKLSGSARYMDFSSNADLYELLCYVPREKYSTLPVYIQEVKAAASTLWPMFVPMEYETASFYDNTVDAHMVSIQYRNMRYVPKGGIKNGPQKGK